MADTYGIDVEAFLGNEDLLLIRRHARRPRYRCPLVHHEHDHVDPGFVVELRTGLWCCHKCPGDSAGPLTGNLITFVERRYDLDRAAARDYLAAQHGASFGRRVEPDPKNPFSPAARRARGQVVSGKKPGSTRFALRIKERNVQQVALGQERLKLRRWIESEFGVGKRYANYVIRTMLDEGLLFEIDGDVYGAIDDARAAEGSLSFLDEANCPPSDPRHESAHPPDGSFVHSLEEADCNFERQHSAERQEDTVARNDTNDDAWTSADLRTHWRNWDEAVELLKDFKPHQVRPALDDKRGTGERLSPTNGVQIYAARLLDNIEQRYRELKDDPFDRISVRRWQEMVDDCFAEVSMYRRDDV